MISKFSGVGPALVTPFKADKSIDFDGLEKLVNHVSLYADFLVVLGTTGESATLSDTEKASVLDFVKQKNRKKLPIVYGAGGNDTRAVIDHIKTANLEGVDAILSASPYYNKPSQEGIYQHYRAIAEASPLPLILYNVPGRTASNINAATTLRLAGHNNIIGIKEASGNMEQCMEIAAGKPADFLLISGDDMLTTSMISFGAVGVISVLANAFPDQFSKMVNAARNGDFTQASKSLFSFLRINPLMYQESNPVGVKAALKYYGICSDEVRLPLVKPSESLSLTIAEIIKEDIQ